MNAPTTNLDCVYIYVNNKHISVAAFLAMDKMLVSTVDARGCRALTALDAPEAGYVYARGCTALTALDAPKASTVDASGCTALTALDAPEAGYVYARGCTALTALDAPKASTVDASGCTALTDAFIAGRDSRKFSFIGMTQRGERRVFAGCRNFSIDVARKHWGARGESNRPDCLVLVEKIAADNVRRERGIAP